LTRSSPGQLSFSSGEISPLLAARWDYQRYQSGLAACVGFIPLRQGGFTRAPGTWYRGQSRSNLTSRLIPFVFADNDACVLEFTNNRMRVWRYGALILSGGIPYELNTPFSEAELPKLQWVQSADVLYIASGTRPIKKLSRFALDNWTIVDARFSGGPFQVQNLDTAVTIQASAATGAGIILTGVGNPFAANMVGSLLRLEPKEFADIALWVGNQALTVGDIRRYDGNIYELTAGTNSGVNPPTHTEGVHKYDGVDNTSWRFLSDGVGIAKITAYTHSNSVTADVVKRLPSPVVTDPTYRWSLGAWSERNGYPAAIEIYDQRLCAASTAADPRTVWFSAIGDFEDFAPSTFADGSFAYAIAGKSSVNRILWLCAGKRALHIGGLGEEFSSRSATSGVAIGPTMATFGFDSSYGSVAQQPIAPDGKPIFISRDRKRILELAYAFETDANEPRELSLASEHLGQRNFLDMVWQSSPLRLCWVRRGGGDLAVMVYDPTEDVLGWGRHTIRGVVETMAVTPSADGGADVLMMCVRRTIDGATVRCIEEFADAYGVIVSDDPIYEANHLFSALRFEPGSPTATFTVPHLAGEDVLVWTEVGQFGPVTVAADGAVTIDFPVSHAIIGLSHSGHMTELLDIPAPGRDGLTLGRRKKLQKGSGIALHKTSGGRVRANMRDVGQPVRSSAWEQLIQLAVGTEPTVALSGNVQVDITGDNARNISIEFQPDGAKPMTVLAVVPRVEEVGG
jgi:hypothetical protein